MTERQRQIFMFIEARQGKGLTPSILEITRGTQITELLVYECLYSMRDLGMVNLQKVRRGASFVTEVRLTSKAQALIPRVKELTA